MSIKQVIIYDKPTSIFNQLSTYLKEHDYNIIIINDASIESFLSKYKNLCELIIIDFSVKNSREILDIILKNNPNQRIVITSDDLECAKLKICDECFNNNNITRLLKPIDLIDVIKMAHTPHECKRYIENIFLMKLLKIEKEINDLFPAYRLDREKLLYVNISGSMQYVRYLLLLTEKLDFYEIKHEVNLTGCIQILNSDLGD